MTGEEIVRVYDEMDKQAGNWLNLWQECVDWAMPTNDGVLSVRTKGSEKPAQRMIDTGIEASVNLASGIFSHLFPPNMVWGVFRHPLPEIQAKEKVAKYFEEVSRIIHRLLISSNFAQEEYQTILAWVVLGTNCLAVEEDDTDVVRFCNHMINNIRIQQNHLGKVDVVAREIELTPRQAMQKFGRENLIAAELESLVNDYDSHRGDHDYKEECKFIHYVAPREDFDPDKKTTDNKPVMSVYVSRKSKEKVKTKKNDLEEEGFDLSPYKVARFMIGNNEIYGRSPISMSLARLRGLNVIRRSLYISSEQNANPQWLTPDDDSVSGISNKANAIIRWRIQNGQLGKPERLPPNGDPGIAYQMFEMDDLAIKKMCWNDKFDPLEDYRNMTAFEANERVTAGLMKTTPFTSRYIDEHVRPVMHHVYYIAQKKGLLPEVPEELKQSGGQYEIDFVGRLALATKSFETLGAISSLRIIGETAQFYPEMAEFFDNIDVDKFGKEVWYANSGNMNVFVPEKGPGSAEAKRQARQREIEQQQKVEAMPKIADAAQKLSGDVSDTSVLSEIAGRTE